MSQWGKMGKQYWQNELQNMLGIQSGAMQPTDLPEFKGMANQYNAQSNQELSRIIQQLGQRGITGGAASGVIQNSQDNTNQNLLKMIQAMYATTNQRGAQASDKGTAWDLARQQQWLQAHGQRQRIDTVNREALMNKIKTGVAMAAAPFTGGLSLTGMGATTSGVPGMEGGGGNADWYNRMYNNPNLPTEYKGW